MTDDQKPLEQWIAECADSLREKQRRDQELERRQPEEGEAFALRADVKDRLQDALKSAEKLQKKLYPLMMQARDIPFEGMEKRIVEAWKGANDSWLACTLALSDSLPKPGNIALKYRYHRSAAELAVAIDDKNARRIAARIIEVAGLEEDYSEQSMDNWLSDARKAESDHDPK